MTYEELQAEQWEWASARFGNERTASKALEPLAGVVEEFGELADAVLRGNATQVEDAIGDAVIYMCDVCNRMGWKMPGVRTHSLPCNNRISLLGRLSHSVLKTAQGIRQNEDHAAVGQQAIYWLLDQLDNVAAAWHIGDALSCAEVAWTEVRERSAGHAAIPKSEVA